MRSVKMKYLIVSLLIIGNVMAHPCEESDHQGTPHLHEQLKTLMCKESSREALEAYKTQLKICTEEERESIAVTLNAWSEGIELVGQLRADPLLWFHFARFVERWDSSAPQANEYELSKLNRCNLFGGRTMHEIIKHIGATSWPCFVELKTHIDDSGMEECEAWGYLNAARDNIAELKAENNRITAGLIVHNQDTEVE